MQLAKLIFGIVLMVFGVVAGIYAGIWWAFIGGIIDVVDAFSAASVSATAVAFGVAKVVFAAPIGWLSFTLFFATGYVFVKSVDQRKL